MRSSRCPTVSGAGGRVGTEVRPPAQFDAQRKSDPHRPALGRAGQDPETGRALPVTHGRSSNPSRSYVASATVLAA